MGQVLEVLRAIAEETRLRLTLICNEREFTVSELTRILGQSQPRVSRHLKLLCDAEVLEKFREQNFVYYRISRKGKAWPIAEFVMEQVEAEESVFRVDQVRVREILDERAREADQTLADLPDDFYGFRLRKVDEATVDSMILEQTRELTIGELLDMGTGTGRMLRLLAGKTEHAVGIDISPQMLRLARSQLNQAGLGKFSVRYGDMYHLDFPEASFDTITMDHVLGESESPLKVLEEARRLLRPGGHWIIVHFQPELKKQRSESFFESRKSIKNQVNQFGLELKSHKVLPGSNGIVNLICARKSVDSDAVHRLEVLK